MGVSVNLKLPTVETNQVWRLPMLLSTKVGDFTLSSLQHQSCLQRFGWKNILQVLLIPTWHTITASILVKCWKSSVFFSNYIAAVTYYIYAEPAQSFFFFFKTKNLIFIFHFSLQAKKQYMLAVVWVIFARFGSYSYVDTVYNGPKSIPAPLQFIQCTFSCRSCKSPALV